MTKKRDVVERENGDKLKLMLKKIQKKIQIFFVRYGRIKLVRSLGTLLYKAGLLLLLARLNFVKDILSVYSRTNFEGSFYPGQSDYDLVIIYNEKESDDFNFVVEKKIRQTFRSVAFYLPFFQHCLILPDKLFELYQEMMSGVADKINKKTINWELVYGKETRNFDLVATASPKANHLFFWFYNNLVYSAILFYGRKDVNLRRPIKLFLDLLEILDQSRGGAVEQREFNAQAFLRNFGVEEEFISFIERFRGGNYRGDSKCIIHAIYYLIRIIEAMPVKEEQPIKYRWSSSSRVIESDTEVQASRLAEKIGTENIESACLAESWFDDKFILFIFLKEELLSVEFLDMMIARLAENIACLNEFSSAVDELKRRSVDDQFLDFQYLREYLGICPVIVTQKIVNSGYFTAEGPNAPLRDIISFNAKVVAGKAPSLTTGQSADLLDFVNCNFWGVQALRFQLLRERGIICISRSEIFSTHEKYYGKFPDDELERFKIIKKQARIAYGSKTPEEAFGDLSQRLR